ncbi:uncharacterized protein [Nicotiana tomentosiformis]|uniref:uncharacterized protein n=1 Tax=Nicotiana tomentosiformis TaxID=4098 RepID=UPI00388CCD7D
MLSKDDAMSWTEEYQKAFNKIKEYLSEPPVLVPPEPGRPLMLYMSVLDGAFRCVMGKHDETGRKEQIAQKLKRYFCAYTTYFISMMDPLIYIFQKPMPRKVVKGQALANHLAENPVDGEYELFKMYFLDEEVSFVGEDIAETYDSWRMFFEGAANFKRVGIKVVLLSETGQHYLVSAKLWFPCTNNMEEYEACILGLRLAIDMNVQELLVIEDSDLLRFTKIEFKHVPRVQNEFADALATLSSMMQHPDKNFIDPIPIEICKQPTYCAHIEEAFEGNPWFHDIKEYLKKVE